MRRQFQETVNLGCGSLFRRENRAKGIRFEGQKSNTLRTTRGLGGAEFYLCWKKGDSKEKGGVGKKESTRGEKKLLFADPLRAACQPLKGLLAGKKN